MVSLITVPPQGEESVSSGVVPRVVGLREKNLEDYKERAFRKELWPDPPQRGTYGMDTIRLKEGAV